MVPLYTAPPAGGPRDHNSLLAKFDALVAKGLVFCSPSKIIRLEEKGFIVSDDTRARHLFSSLIIRIMNQV